MAARLQSIGLAFLAWSASLVAIAEPANEKLAQVRPAALAGFWYPEQPDELAQTVDRLLAEAAPQPQLERTAIRALMVPHAAYRFSGAVAAAGYKLVQGRHLARVIVLAPAHRGHFRGLSIADVSHYETPLGRVPLDHEIVTHLRDGGLVVSDPSAHRREHSIEIQLPLLQRTLPPGWKLVPILVGQMTDADYASAATLLRPYADHATLIVVSGDFTHYGPTFGYVPFPPNGTVKQRIRELDMGAYERIAAIDPDGLADYQERTGITACSVRPATVLLRLLPNDSVSKLVRYATSGELTGNFRHSVSYVAAVFTRKQPLGPGAALGGAFAQDAATQTGPTTR